MKHLTLALALLFAVFQAACSGGGAGGTIPPPVGAFSNADLNGQYAFTMSGQGANGFFARVGVFVADGNGHITGGIEDVDVGAGDETLTFNSGTTYTVNADGRGTITLANATTGSNLLIFSVTLTSPTQGFIVETDLNSAASGTFKLQNTSSFTPASLSASYLFDFSGLSPDQFQNFLPDSLVGQMTLSNGALQGGVLDENFAAQLSGPLAISATNGIAFDTTNGPTFGRGTLTLTASGTQFQYIFYVVDSTQLHLMEINSNSLTVGDAIRQTAPPTSNAAFTGSFAYLLVGGSGAGPDTRVGRFTADGNGGLTAIAQDENNSGTNFAVPDGTLSAMTYDVDTNFPGSGRVTMTFSDSKLTKNGPYTFIAYMASGSQGVIQDVTNTFLLDGQILAQTGAPFSSSTVAGNYAFNFNGIGNNNTNQVSAEEDFVGQLKVTSATSNNVTGAMDFSAFSSNQGVFLDVGVAGGLTVAGDGTDSTGTRNVASLKTNNSPSTTYVFQVYIVNANTAFILCTNTNNVDTGVLVRQSK